MSDIRHLHRANPGPWGDLEYYYTYLDPPEVFFSGSLRSERLFWFFARKTRKGALETLEKCGVSKAAIRKLDAVDDVWRERETGMLLWPPHDIARELSPEVRQNLYAELLSTREGRDGSHYFNIEMGNYRDFTLGLNLPGELIERVEGLFVQVGGNVVMMDGPLILSELPDHDLKTRFLKSLARSQTMIIRLRIDESSDLKNIAEYWSGGPNRSRALPLLESVLRTRGVTSIDVLHLLPPVPRKTLYTFAQERDYVSGVAPDCYWASMNFFSHGASSRHLDDMPRNFYLEEDFEPVDPPYSFGDVIVLHNRKESSFVHSWVHIADDIVYTKNGKSSLFPFVLMRLQAMQSRYSDSHENTVQGFRLRQDR